MQKIFAMKTRNYLPLIILTLFYSLLISCTSSSTSPKEGFIDVKGGKVWYRINGTGTKPALVLLHGGPGSSSYGLENLKELSNDRPVIFIDQLGCGRSSRITDTSLMTIENYVEQLEQIRTALHLENFYLYGHSWGTMLGIDYYIKYPSHIKSIIFSSPLFSTESWTKDADTLIASLPDSVQKNIRVNEKNKTYDNTAYQDAVTLYYKNFLRRTERTKGQADTAKLFSGSNVYEFMWGPSEFTATGNLLKYDRLAFLATIKVPTLLVAGEFDEARPSTIQHFQTMIPGSEFKMIKNSGHATMQDNKEEYLATLKAFLDKVDNFTTNK
jgi:proline iminopeptidase